MDTNVLVRYIIRDNADQAARATETLEAMTEASPGYISLVVIAELAWVLQSGYRLTRTELFAALDGLLNTRAIKVERAEIVRYAMRIFAQSTADFSDCLIARLAHAAGCGRTLTLDRNAAKYAGMTLLGQ